MAGALDGLKVLEIGQWIAGPYCAMILSDLGADVIKVERPGRGDDQRHSPPFVNGESSLFRQVNRNKRSIALDLSTKAGIDACMRLASEADVVIDNFRSGTLARYGLDANDLVERNPRLIYCAISGFGRSGVLSGRSGMDLIAQAASGIVSLNRDETGRPSKIPMAVADISTGLYAVIGVLAALAAREKSGKGQILDLSLLESLLSLMPSETSSCLTSGADPLPYSKRGSRNAAPYQILRTKDGWMAIAAAAQPLWERLCRILGCEAYLEDARFSSNATRIENSIVLEELLEAQLVARTSDDWLAAFDEAGIPASQVFSMSEILAHPHLAARGLIAEPAKSSGLTAKAVMTPISFSQTPVSFASAAPGLGEHTDDILDGLAARAWPAANRHEVHAPAALGPK